MDFIIKSTQLSIEWFIQHHPQSRNEAPTRAAVYFDQKNMFNSVSHEQILHIIKSKYPELLPLATSLYNQPGTVHCRQEDGTWKTISMAVGVNQGCPLSSIFASLVLNEVLHPLNILLKQRTPNRLACHNLGDDSYGSVIHLMAYI
mmetsp:Transcript_12439/g.27034  ORF Transcript_12439/g.27034 Transcript_12439/m.27034 type:complete len:146 (+) Transcript_12439:30-467(+)